MQRYIAAALIACAVLAVPALGAGGDPKGAPCTDVIGGSGSYNAAGTENTVLLVADLAKSPCERVTYTLSVYDDAAMTTLLAETSSYAVLPSLNPPQIGFNIPGVVETDGIVCVVLTTASGGGGHVADRAPDVDDPNGPCTSISAMPPAFGGFN